MNKQSKSQWLSGFLEMTHGRPMCFLGVWPLTGSKAGSQKGDQTITKLMVSFPQGWCRIRDFTEMVLIQSVCWCIDDSIYIYTYIYIHIYIYTYIYIYISIYTYSIYIEGLDLNPFADLCGWNSMRLAKLYVHTFVCIDSTHLFVMYIEHTLYIYILPYITYRSILIHSIYIHIYTYMYI